MRLLVEHRIAHFGHPTLKGTVVVDETERLARIGDIVDDEDSLVVQSAALQQRRQQHRLGECLPDPGVELHVQRNQQLAVEGIRQCPGGDESAAGDPEDDVGDKSVVGDGTRELTARLTVELPRQDLAVCRGRVQGSTDLSQARICGVTGWVDGA